MDQCTVETGLLRKKPCGNAGVVKCANCERALCSQHAIPQMTEAGKKSGTFLCKECDAAARDYEKRMRYSKQQAVAKSITGGPKPAAKPAAKTVEPPREHSGEIAFTAGTNAPPPKPPAAKKPEPPREDSGMIEYTPAKKPTDKK